MRPFAALRMTKKPIFQQPVKAAGARREQGLLWPIGAGARVFLGGWIYRLGADRTTARALRYPAQEPISPRVCGFAAASCHLGLGEIPEVTINRFLRKEFYEFQPPLDRYSEIEWAFHKYRHNLPLNFMPLHGVCSPGFKANNEFWDLSRCGKSLDMVRIGAPVTESELTILPGNEKGHPGIY